MSVTYLKEASMEIDGMYDRMRGAMVKEQLIPRGISDPKVINAFGKVPRHEFIPQEYRDAAYSDYPLPIGDNQTISQPYMVALMTESLKIEEGDKVLEIGTGSGYQTAVLSEMAQFVYSIERYANLAGKADRVLSGLGYTNYKIRVGDGTLGWQEHAPYDGIVVTAGAPGIPESLAGQLKEGGRLVIPIGNELSQVLTVVEKERGSLKMTQVCGCVFVPLIGKEGWPG